MCYFQIVIHCQTLTIIGSIFMNQLIGRPPLKQTMVLRIVSKRIHSYPLKHLPFKTCEASERGFFSIPATITLTVKPSYQVLSLSYILDSYHLAVEQTLISRYTLASQSCLLKPIWKRSRLTFSASLCYEELSYQFNTLLSCLISLDLRVSNSIPWSWTSPFIFQETN